MATRAATRDAARAQSTRSGRVPQELIDELIRPGLGQKDVRLRSLAPTARRQEAIRRLNDPETTAGKPGTNLCRYAGDDKQMTGKRPGYYNKRNISASAVRLCKELVDDAWSDPAFLKEEKLACGDDKKWVFAHQRGDKRVKGHCRKVDAPRPRAKKAKPDPRQKELAALIRKRDKTSNLSEYSSLDKQVKALRAQMVPKREPVLTEPDDISQFDFSVVRPNNQPRRPPPTSRPVAVSTRRTPTVITSSMQTYIDSLPRGERRKAQNVMTAYRNFAGLDGNAAIARYEQRRESDAQAPVGATEFDDSGEEDQELGEFGSGLDGGAFDAERRALRDRKNELAHRRDMQQRSPRALRRFHALCCWRAPQGGGRDRELTRTVRRILPINRMPVGKSSLLGSDVAGCKPADQNQIVRFHSFLTPLLRIPRYRNENEPLCSRGSAAG